MSQAYEHKLSDISALEDVCQGTTVLIARNSITEKNTTKTLDGVVVVRYKASVWGAGHDEGHEGIWITKFNTEPSDKKALAVERFRW
jgi:hypothetical protein